MTLLRQTFQVTLQQDVIFSASAATLGGQAGLDFLPGSVFLGALASQCYADLDADQAWTLFHSGQFKFLDALPLVEQQPSWPLPLSWHHYKGEEVTQDSGLLDNQKVFDAFHAEGNLDNSRQPKQMRNGYITAAGHLCRPNLSQRMKTAIDPKTGRAAEGQLFGYQSLDAGQVYYFEVQAPQEHQALFETIIKKLTGTLRLGRSRSAQYGRVEVKPIQGLDHQPAAITQGTRQLTIWLMSDLALVNTHGQATLQPEPKLLGLPEGSRWLADQSFLRTRSYSPFNAHRRCYDPERQVISRGSVLRFEMPTEISPKTLEASLTLGRFQEQGLGRVAINPQLLATTHPRFAQTPSQKKTEVTSSASVKPPAKSVLAKVLRARLAVQQEGNQADQDARSIFDQLLAALKSARNWQGITPSEPMPDAPGRSQWGRIKELANQHRSEPKVLWQKLATNSDAVITPRSGWQLEIGPSLKLSDRLIGTDKEPGLLAKHQHKDYFPEIVGRLAVLGLSSTWQTAIEGEAIKEAI